MVVSLRKVCDAPHTSCGCSGSHCAVCCLPEVSHYELEQFLKLARLKDRIMSRRPLQINLNL